MLVDDLTQQRRTLVAKIEPIEWRPFEKSVHHGFILLGLARTGGVHEPPTGPKRLSSSHQQIDLLLGQTRQIACCTAPSNIWIAPNRAESRTGCIHEHAIEAMCERQRSSCRHMHDMRMLRATATDRVDEEADTACAHVARDE